MSNPTGSALAHKEPGQVAFEARFSEEARRAGNLSWHPGDTKLKPGLSDEAKAVWAGVEAAVLAATPLSRPDEPDAVTALTDLINSMMVARGTEMDAVVGPTYYCHGIHLNKARKVIAALAKDSSK